MIYINLINFNKIRASLRGWIKEASYFLILAIS
jgi:hypothetical protein